MNAVITTGRAGMGSLAPQSFAEAVEFSKMLARSGMVPKDYTGKPEAVLVALQWGAEVGLGPLQALNGISVINGKPALWGDAALALVRGHPACERISEGIDGEGETRAGFCEVVRRGEPPQRRTFSVADAKKAGLWGKSGPWTQYPDRMLQLRARGFAIRDVFPDALRGVITAEEAQDMPAEPRHVQNLAEPPPIPSGLPAAREPAPPGSMRAEVEAMETRAVLDPEDMTLKNVPARAWRRAVTRALEKCHDLDTLNGWWQGTAPIIDNDDERAAVEALVVERRAALADAPA